MQCTVNLHNIFSLSFFSLFFFFFSFFLEKSDCIVFSFLIIFSLVPFLTCCDKMHNDDLWRENKWGGGKKKKIGRTPQRESICCHGRLCQKQRICLHISIRPLQVNIVQKTQVLPGFVQILLLYRKTSRFDFTAVATWQKPFYSFASNVWGWKKKCSVRWNICLGWEQMLLD